MGREFRHSRMKDSEIPVGIPRWLECAAAGVALLVLGPVLVVTASAIWMSSRGPVLFRQRRVGQGGRPFTMLKFRSMRVHDAGPQITAEDDDRITLVGRVCRKSKLDELPALWNVLRGDMSLVGPRPEVMRFVDLQDARWRRVLVCRPGLTDSVTLKLRNEEELMANVEGDREAFYRDILLPYKLAGYAADLDKRSFWSDVRVLFWSTVAIVAPRTTHLPTMHDLAHQSDLQLRRPVDGLTSGKTHAPS